MWRTLLRPLMSGPSLPPSPPAKPAGKTAVFSGNQHALAAYHHDPSSPCMYLRQS